MRRTSLAVLGAIAVFSFGPAARSAPPRPKIVGVANIAFKVTSLETARGFYGKVLGYQEAFTIKETGGGPDLTCFKVNDRQYIEVSGILKDPKEDRLAHIAFETTGARELRDYLASKGVAVPDRIEPGPDGNLSFTVSDPDGDSVEFVQYLPESIHSRSFGKFMPATRVSDHILHVGIYVRDRAAADHFYKDILGFRLLMEGDTGLARNVVMLVPDGSDFVEYSLVNSPKPLPPAALGATNHVCLLVTDIQAVYQAVVERGYKPLHEPVIGKSGHWLVNLFDPDGSRIEFIVPKPARTP
jgi:lactoylglutathione lyase